MWAWRWPHADTRNTGAIVVGTAVATIGVVALWAARRGRGWVPVAATVARVGALTTGLLALDAVTERQRRNCGDYLDACDSLMPPLHRWLAALIS